MKAGTALDEAHRQQVEAALHKYPFFALGRMMAAKLATKLGDPRAPQLRFLASLYAPARQHYAFFLEERLRPRVPPPPRIGQASGREGTTPPTSSSKPQEESASNDDSGPEPMPISNAFWPPLHGWIAARIALYHKLSTRLWHQLCLPPLEVSTSLSQAEVGDLSPHAEEKASASPEPIPISEPHPAEAPPLTPSAQLPQEAHLTPENNPTSISAPQSPLPELTLPSSFSFSTTGDFQEELIATLEKSHTTQGNTGVLPSLPLSSSLFIQFELSSALPQKTPSSSAEEGAKEKELPLSSVLGEKARAPREEAPAQPEAPSAEALGEADQIGFSHLHRPFIPLEGEGKPIHLPSESEAPLPPDEPSSASPLSLAEGMSHFHRPFIPLEETESSIHLSAEAPSLTAPPPQTGPKVLSDSPLRPFVPLEIDIAASIHLPVPEPEEEPAHISPPPLLPSAGESVSEVPPEGPPSPSLLSSPTWQSFLKELEGQTLTPLTSGASPVHELEQLRKEFIRRLLAQRPQAALTPDKPTQPNVIDLLIEKLHSFPKASAESGPPELSAPVWEPPPTQPLIYTETMARVYWRQGDIARAIQVYEALCSKHPEKAAYYQEQIARIRAGEAP